MKKTIRLTESELVGLVKRILSEQDFNKLGALGEITKKYIGETANLYKDPQNKKFVKQIHFEEITPEPDGRIQLMAKGETFPYYYYCNKPNVIVGIYDKNVIVFDESFEFYSNNLTPQFQKDFCTTSSGDKPVPKATFASANKSQPSNLA
jgi:hypothetical protein